MKRINRLAIFLMLLGTLQLMGGMFFKMNEMAGSTMLLISGLSMAMVGLLILIISRLRKK